MRILSMLWKLNIKAEVLIILFIDFVSIKIKA
jgi:hypothetical protein